MHWEDCEVEWWSLYFQAFSSYTMHSSFPFQPQSHTGIPISSSSGAFQNSEDCNVAIPSKCSPLPMPIISQSGGQMSELYTSQFWHVWREEPTRQGHLALQTPTWGPLETFRGCSNVFLPPAFQRCQKMGAGVAFKDSSYQLCTRSMGFTQVPL